MTNRIFRDFRVFRGYSLPGPAAISWFACAFGVVACLALSGCDSPPGPADYAQATAISRAAAAALTGLVAEIDRRGDLLAAAGARDLAGYNRRAGATLSYLLCYADECLDMALAAGARSELTAALQTITIRGRSAGVLLWAATQHAAAVAGLPRVVNVNLVSRLVFRVADGSAARAAGCAGAEAISRSTPGRMLAHLEGEPVELQAYWLSDEALAEIAERVTW